MSEDDQIEVSFHVPVEGHQYDDAEGVPMLAARYTARYVLINPVVDGLEALGIVIRFVDGVSRVSLTMTPAKARELAESILEAVDLDGVEQAALIKKRQQARKGLPALLRKLLAGWNGQA
jgi:hypothetical protein